MGAWGRSRSHAATPWSPAGRDVAAKEDHRARLRHAEALDGLDALPDAWHGERRYRVQPQCAGLQPQTRHLDLGHRQDDEGDETGGWVTTLLGVSGPFDP